MKIKHILLLCLLILFFVISGCNVSDKNRLEDNVEDKKSKDNIINLTFQPIIPEDLEVRMPSEKWQKVKTVNYYEVEASIHLYIDLTEKSLEHADVYAFLEYNNSFYNIGMVGAYGVDDINIEIFDVTSDEMEEIVIVGSMGATYSQTLIMRYNEENDRWIKLIAVDSPMFVDLDNDENEELVVTSKGSIPSSVQILRWNQDKFEMVDIANATGKDYAQVISNEGEFIFEVGRETQYYKYDKGSLIPISNIQN